MTSLPAAGQMRGGASITDRAARENQRPEQQGGMIDGIVTDTLLKPLPVSDITIVGTGARITTTANGRFRFLKVPAGQYLVVVRRIGYAPTSGIIQVNESDTLRLAYTLARSISVMDTVRVNARRVTMRMADFEARRSQGVGQFLTRDEIERRGSIQISDFLRNMRGIDVSRQAQDQFGGVIAISRREGGSVGGDGAGACAMQVFLDGIVLPRAFNLELLPPPKQIAGVEVYSGAATVPPQFGGADRRCGVIAVWTRDGY
ncbi:MAG: carboxypeptidase regulatory-like domain-containing protein [Gemmatimonas sp.]